MTAIGIYIDGSLCWHFIGSLAVGRPLRDVAGLAHPAPPIAPVDAL